MADVNKQKQLAQELSTKLWAMANDLRGNMEAYEFKNYILGLIFYKHLSDRTESFMNELLQDDDISYVDAWEDVAYHDDLVEDSLSTLGYVLEPKYLFGNVVKMIENGTFTIDYMEEIINSITESTLGQDSEADFNGLFEDMDLKSSKLGKEVSQRGKLIGKIIQTIDTINFQMGDTDVDILGSAYITLIGNFASTAGKKGGEFYTPTNMSKLLARLATVGLSDVLSACDPACGSGSLLLQVGEYANVRKYYGQEMTSSTYNLARMNMILHDIRYQNFNIVNVDTLEDDSNFEDERFTVQVANPPYSTKWSADIKFLEDERFSAYGKLAPSSKADFAFVQHMIYHMADGDSRIAVLLPHGVLFRGSSEEVIRKYIVKELNYLDAVIGLPANCFQGTSIPVACLVFKKERNGNSDDICFIDASKEFVAGKAMNYITDEHIDKIVKTYEERKEVEKYCHIAKMDEIIENDYNLNIPRYVDTFEEEEAVDLYETFKKLDETQTKIADAKVEANKFLEELGLPTFRI
ncbi:MAG: type I restriction-modification system subunit M [Lachnospiraceae bacterium]|nr:type I restriction-modification system subunit M [Lachnospiraceae bacterium]MBP3475629.1 type I restriction-modification system subunit M [Lachnospiraceae bacterium]